MKRKAMAGILTIVGVFGVVVLVVAIVSPRSVGLAGASATAACPFSVNPGLTYWVEYNTTTGAIQSIVQSAYGVPPPVVSSVQVNGTLGVTIMCAIYEHSNTSGYALPWHVNLATRQVVES